MEKPNCIIKLFDKTQSQLLETIEKIKSILDIENLELMFVKDEEKINTLPFLE